MKTLLQRVKASITLLTVVMAHTQLRLTPRRPMPWTRCRCRKKSPKNRLFHPPTSPRACAALASLLCNTRNYHTGDK